MTGGYMALAIVNKNAYRILLRKPEGQRPLGREA
jgi:hypothetical protein